jgi:hypothetical protein
MSGQSITPKFDVEVCNELSNALLPVSTSPNRSARSHPGLAGGLNEDWLFVSCRLLDSPPRNLIIWLSPTEDETCFVPIYVCIDDLPLNYEAYSGLSISSSATCILEYLQIFSVQVSSENALNMKEIKLPGNWEVDQNDNLEPMVDSKKVGNIRGWFGYRPNM